MDAETGRRRPMRPFSFSRVMTRQLGGLDRDRPRPRRPRRAPPSPRAFPRARREALDSLESPPRGHLVAPRSTRGDRRRPTTAGEASRSRHRRRSRPSRPRDRVVSRARDSVDRRSTRGNTSVRFIAIVMRSFASVREGTRASTSARCDRGRARRLPRAMRAASARAGAPGAAEGAISSGAAGTRRRHSLLGGITPRCVGFQGEGEKTGGPSAGSTARQPPPRRRKGRERHLDALE